MQPLSAPGIPTNPRPRAARGRWIWRLSGVATFGAIAAFSSWAVIRAVNPPQGPPPMSVVPTRTVTVRQPVTALNVESYGAPIKVTTGPAGPVRVVESISFQADGDGPPAVTRTVSHGLLTLAAPQCAVSNCSVGFSVTVPPGVQVNAIGDGGSVTVIGTGAADINSGGGPVYAGAISGPLTVSAEGGGVTVNNAAGADIDSGGGPVTATGITGKLTVHAEGGGVTVSRAPTADIDSGGGPVDASDISGQLTIGAEGGGVTVAVAGPTQIDSGGGPVTATTVNGALGVTAEGGGVEANDVTGTLNVDTGGGPLNANGLTSPSVTVNGDGGSVTLGFFTAPTSVRIDTGGGDALLTVPGGPYAVTTDTGGSTDSVLIAASASASSSISVTTDGGNLQIGP